MKTSSLLVSIALAAAATTTSLEAHAEHEVGLGIVYDPRLPLGGLHDLMPSAGALGMTARWDYFLFEHLSVGLAVQYHQFQRRGGVETIAITNGAATGDFVSYAYFFSALPSVRWYPWTDGAFRPFAELAAGVTSVRSVVAASDLGRRDLTGGFVAQPSVGLLWAVARDDGEDLGEDAWAARPPRESIVAVSASLAWSFTSARVLDVDAVSYVGAQLGIYTKL